MYINSVLIFLIFAFALYKAEISLTNGDCRRVTPCLMIDVEHLTFVLSSVCSGHTWDLRTEIHNISYTQYNDTESLIPLS